jgi:hypothetical protein
MRLTRSVFRAGRRSVPWACTALIVIIKPATAQIAAVSVRASGPRFLSRRRCAARARRSTETTARHASAGVRPDKSAVLLIERNSTPVSRHKVAPRVIDYATYFKSKENLVPESRTRKTAVEKQKLKAQRESKPKKIKPPASRRWVPPTFIAVGLLGVAWLITYYIAGTQIPLMDMLGNWNILIGMGGMAAAFVIATLWR